MTARSRRASARTRSRTCRRSASQCRATRRSCGTAYRRPEGTPPSVIGTFNGALKAVLADPRLEARLLELGGLPMPTTPAEFGKLVADETEKWGKVVRAANIKAE
jgi:tripartite-type tricarboxylate transporter receptor subunit TctC